MHSHVVGIADLGCTQVDTRHQLVDKRRFAHTTIATEQRDLALHQRTQVVNTLTCLGRHLATLIANGLIEVDHSLLIASQVIVQQVGLVEDQHHWHTISLGRSQETVDECCTGLGIDHRDHQECLVHVGSYDMALLREVDTLANDVVAAILDSHNPSFLVNLHPVAHSHGIGGADAFQAEVTLYLTVKQLVIVRTNGVPTACILNDKSFQLSIIN